MTAPRCPVCDAPDRACTGHPWSGTPVDDLRLTRLETPAMSDEAPTLGVYTYTLNGVEITGQLSDADAERLGATRYTADGGEKATTAQTKARKSTANKAE